MGRQAKWQTGFAVRGVSAGMHGTLAHERAASSTGRASQFSARMSPTCRSNEGVPTHSSSSDGTAWLTVSAMAVLPAPASLTRKVAWKGKPWTEEKRTVVAVAVRSRLLRSWMAGVLCHL